MPDATDAPTKGRVLTAAQQRAGARLLRIWFVVAVVYGIGAVVLSLPSIVAAVATWGEAPLASTSALKFVAKQTAVIFVPPLLVLWFGWDAWFALIGFQRPRDQKAREDHKYIVRRWKMPDSWHGVGRRMTRYEAAIEAVVLVGAIRSGEQPASVAVEARKRLAGTGVLTVAEVAEIEAFITVAERMANLAFDALGSARSQLRSGRRCSSTETEQMSALSKRTNIRMLTVRAVHHRRILSGPAVPAHSPAGMQERSHGGGHASARPILNAAETLERRTSRFARRRR